MTFHYNTVILAHFRALMQVENLPLQHPCPLACRCLRNSYREWDFSICQNSLKGSITLYTVHGRKNVKFDAFFYFHSPLYCCERFIITWTFRCENVNATQNSVLIIHYFAALQTDGRTDPSLEIARTVAGLEGDWAGSAPPPWATDRRRHGTPDKRQL